jgi:hypothetical protein
MFFFIFSKPGLSVGEPDVGIVLPISPIRAWLVLWLLSLEIWLCNCGPSTRHLV